MSTSKSWIGTPRSLSAPPSREFIPLTDPVDTSAAHHGLTVPHVDDAPVTVWAVVNAVVNEVRQRDIGMP